MREDESVESGGAELDLGAAVAVVMFCLPPTSKSPGVNLSRKVPESFPSS